MEMTAARRIEWITTEEYLASEIDSPVKREYVCGFIHAMTWAANGHNRIAGTIYALLDRLLGSSPCQPTNSDTKIRIRQGRDVRFYYPDAAIVCDENPPHEQFEEKPTVIFEVLSESTRRTDMGEKCAAYQTIPSLKHYFLVEQSEPAVVEYRRTKTGFRRYVITGLESEISIPSLSIKLPLAEIYRRISFQPEPDEE
jgi:Uma2 family endonuclease